MTIGPRGPSGRLGNESAPQVCPGAAYSALSAAVTLIAVVRSNGGFAHQRTDWVDREARRAHGLLDLPAHKGAPPPDGTSTDGTSTDEALDADEEEHIVARDPGPDLPDQRRQGSL